MDIFKRPKPTKPFFKAIVNVTQAWGSLPCHLDSECGYEIVELDVGTHIYVDRPYTWAAIPNFMKNMTSIRPSNEDARWPGFFNKYSDDNLFCTMTKKSTQAIYIIMDVDMLVTPFWVSKAYERIDSVEFVSSTQSWSKDNTRYMVYWRR